MHQPHQSEPVKSINTSLFSFFASACASGRLKNHFASAALIVSAIETSKTATILRIITFLYRICAYHTKQFRLAPHNISADDRQHGLSFERPAIEWSILGPAH